MLVVGNMTRVPRINYRMGWPSPSYARQCVNGEAGEFGGSGWGNLGGVRAGAVSAHGRPYSVCLSLPPLSTLMLEHVSDA